MQFKIDPRVALERSYLYGHATRVDPHFTLESVTQLDVDEPTAQQIWKSWRENDANFDLLLQAEHGPGRAVSDDSYGPATERLVDLERCPYPDYVPPDNISYAGLEPWRENLWKSYQNWAKQGSGSWLNCDPEFDGHHSIRINLNMSNAADHWKRDIDWIIEQVTSMYAEFGLAIRYIKNGDPLKAEIEKEFIRIPGGVIGWNEFPRPNRCDQTITGKLDNDYSAPRKMKARLKAHETGHGVGFEHTRGGLMNPTILDGPMSFKGDPHESTARKYWGGEPVVFGPIIPKPTIPINKPLIDDVITDLEGAILKLVNLKNEDNLPEIGL